jgi:hypothetical protein
MANYTINSASDLQAMKDDLDGDYTLAANISLEGTTWIPIMGNPIVNNDSGSHAFTGTFNGNGYTISDLRQYTANPFSNADGFFGLFGAIGDGAEISNVKLEDFTFYIESGYSAFIGALAGDIRTSQNSATVEDCHVINFKVIADTSGVDCSFIGGLIGDIRCSRDAGGTGPGTVTVTSCSVTGEIDINDVTSDPVFIGGISGEVQGCNIDSCTTDIDINIDADDISYIAGLTGYVNDKGGHNVNITNCVSSGDIVLNGPTGDINYCAGFIGNMDDGVGGTINACSSTGSLTINADDCDYCAGFSGYSSGDSTISKCYSTTDVTINSNSGADYCTGFLGYVIEDIIVEDCYAQGDVSITAATAYGVAGFCGQLGGNATMKNCYSSGDLTFVLSGNNSSMSSGGFIGYCTEQLINCFYAGAITITCDTFGQLGGFAGYYKTATPLNCSWLTSAYDYAIGSYNGDTLNIATLAEQNYGTDETVYTNFQKKTTQDVFDQGNANAWDFATPIWYERYLVDEYPTFEAVIIPTSSDGGRGGSLQCAYAGTVTTNMASLDHLEGQTVAILANGEVLDEQVVVDGRVTLDGNYSIVKVGLPYYSDLETLNVEVPIGEGTIQSRQVKIGNVTFRLHDTRGGYVGKDEDNIWEAFTQDKFNKSSGQNIGETELFTGDVRVPLGVGFSPGGRVFYRQSDPLPVTIGAIIPEVNIGGVAR